MLRQHGNREVRGLQQSPVWVPFLVATAMAPAVAPAVPSAIAPASAFALRNCKIHFCWRCGQLISGYDHFATSECRLFDDDEIRRWNQRVADSGAVLVFFKGCRQLPWGPSSGQGSSTGSRGATTSTTGKITRLHGIPGSTHPAPCKARFLAQFIDPEQLRQQSRECWELRHMLQLLQYLRREILMQLCTATYTVYGIRRMCPYTHVPLYSHTCTHTHTHIIYIYIYYI